MDESPHYKLWHVPKTNVFILIKFKDKHNKKTIRVSIRTPSPWSLQGHAVFSASVSIAKQKVNKQSILCNQPLSIS